VRVFGVVSNHGGALMVEVEVAELLEGALRIEK
jgi:hypothetical protein